MEGITSWKMGSDSGMLPKLRRDALRVGRRVGRAAVVLHRGVDNLQNCLRLYKHRSVIHVLSRTIGAVRRDAGLGESAQHAGPSSTRGVGIFEAAGLKMLEETACRRNDCACRRNDCA